MSYKRKKIVFQLTYRYHVTSETLASLVFQVYNIHAHRGTCIKILFTKRIKVIFIF